MKEKRALRDVLKNTGMKLKNGMRRFPAAIGLAASASITGVILVHSEDISNDAKRFLTSLILAFVLGVLLSLIIKTIFEQTNSSMRIKVFTWIVFGCLVAFYAMYLYKSMENSEMLEGMRFAGFLLVAFVLFMTAVFRKNTAFQEVFSTLAGWRLAITAIYTLIIWGGISLILFAIEKLLNVNIDNKLYTDTIILAMGFFAPIFFFGGIPSKDEEVEPGRIYKFFKILVIYVIAPLLTAYTVVFYIYALRILFTWDWPDGLVGNMVLWYALIGTVTMYFLHGMDNESRWAAIFGKWFPRVVILPIILLFISLAIRINIYGMTANRYFLAAAGIWMIGSMLYQSIINFKKRSTRIITVSLAIIAVISVTGPWGAFSIGRVSQVNRLEMLLQENGMIENGKVVKAAILPDEKTRGEISSKLQYIGDYYDFKGVDYLPDNFDTTAMSRVMGFEYTYYYEDIYTDPYYSKVISINENSLGGIVEISGYDYIWNSDTWDKTGAVTSIGLLELVFNRDENGSILTIYKDNVVVLEKKMEDYIEPVKQMWEEKNEILTFNDLTFDINSEIMDVRIIFTGLEIYPDDKGASTGWMRFYVLVKLK